jgi:hypothetical protein
MNEFIFRKRFTGSAYFRLPVNHSLTYYVNKSYLRLILFSLINLWGNNLLYCETHKIHGELSIKLQHMKNSDIPQPGDAGELIILFRAESDVFVDESGKVISGKGTNTKQVNDLLKEHKAVLKPIGPAAKQGEKVLPGGMRFFTVTGAKDLEALRVKLLEIPFVDSAYIKPPAEDPDIQE